MGCPAALDLADVATSGCFAAIGPLSGRCFATECVRARFLADALPPWSLGSLADALPPCCSVCWRMLCRRGRLVRWRMLCRRCWVIVLWVDTLPPWLGLVRKKPLHWCFYCRHSSSSWALSAVALLLYPYLFLCLSRLLTTILVVCNMCNEGSVIADL
jgi:hypothetical protein